MTRLTILEYPDPRLRTRARPVTQIDAAMRRLIDDMLETMYAAPGVGLAAPQVDFHQRLLVLDVSEQKDMPLVLINPEILSRGELCMSEEGCLSVPGYYEPVQRARTVRVRAQNRDGKSFEMDCEDLLAVCVQHEMDHLEGKLFVDYISELKRSRIRKKLEKDHRQRSGAATRAPSSAR
jgi:peptide deformylase